MQRRSEQADAPLDSQLERGNEKRRSHNSMTETRCNETRTSAEQQCYIYWGADQLVLCCESTFGPEGVKNKEEILGTSIQDACGLKHLLVKTRFRRPSPLALRA